jgi:hypothetical protein
MTGCVPAPFAKSTAHGIALWLSLCHVKYGELTKNGKR